MEVKVIWEKFSSEQGSQDEENLHEPLSNEKQNWRED